ncbi:MAG: hypothetical protein KJ607_06375 [Bacteroidetes bacterium]|nr:hypothetical protein [Bacteroidota bacterium]
MIRSHANTTDCGRALEIWTRAGGPLAIVGGDVKVGIGTDAPEYTLDVCGTILAKEIIVDETDWCDYVFKEDYMPMTWNEKEEFYTVNKHLPGIAKAEDIEANGLKTGETMKGMILNIEENRLDITDLYKMLIEQKEELSRIKQENKELKQLLQSKDN